MWRCEFWAALRNREPVLWVRSGSASACSRSLCSCGFQRKPAHLPSLAVPVDPRRSRRQRYNLGSGWERNQLLLTITTSVKASIGVRLFAVAVTAASYAPLQYRADQWFGPQPTEVLTKPGASRAWAYEGYQVVQRLNSWAHDAIRMPSAVRSIDWLHG
jgi:hypothetical protein